MIADRIAIIFSFQPFDENDMLTSDETPAVDNLFRDGFVSSFTMILLAEIADKTFFIAAIMGTVYHLTRACSDIDDNVKLVPLGHQHLKLVTNIYCLQFD